VVEAKPFGGRRAPKAEAASAEAVFAPALTGAAARDVCNREPVQTVRKRRVAVSEAAGTTVTAEAEAAKPPSVVAEASPQGRGGSGCLD